MTYLVKISRIFVALVLCLNPAIFPQKTGKYRLKEGTEVNLKFAETVSSKTATEDDPVELVLDEDIKVGDIIVAKRGDKALGKITHAKKAGMMGKAGELSMRIEYLKVGDVRVKLRGKKSKEGESKENSTIVMAVLLSPIILIRKGKNIEIKEGTTFKVYVDEDVDIPAEK